MSFVPEEVRVKLRSRITCPHCWHSFSPEDALWISQHPDLLGDSHLGNDQQQRFLPSRFTVQGQAIDARGIACQELACPNCHLQVPRGSFEMAPLFVSIMGAPSCGKSYFLASMTWQLRRILPEKFAISFADADPGFNKILNQYEENQFFSTRTDELYKLDKTEEQGDLYDVVRYGDQNISYPRPFLFSLRPLESHPNYESSRKLARMLCLYDNAGESFQPGKDNAANPVTRHLSKSQVLMFLFDPTQDPRFRDACKGKTHDPQMTASPVTSRQETILHEVIDRIRRLAGIAQDERYSRPLYVIVTKYDAWSSMLDNEELTPPLIHTTKGDLHAIDLDRVDAMSQKVRSMLWKVSPELVAAAEEFFDHVLFIPASATGRGPELDPVTKQAAGIRPKDIKPAWVEVPLLTMLARRGGGVIPFSQRRTSKNGAGQPATAPADVATDREKFPPTWKPTGDSVS